MQTRAINTSEGYKVIFVALGFAPAEMTSRRLWPEERSLRESRVQCKVLKELQPWLPPPGYPLNHRPDHGCLLPLP